jgi:nucleoside-diphosphate-sugar epimerase
VFERVCILRCAGIYGPGRTRLLEAARSGQPGDPARITNRVHRDDAAAAAVELLAADDEALAAFGPRRAVFVAVDDEPVDDWTVRAWLAAPPRRSGAAPRALGPRGLVDRQALRQRAPAGDRLDAPATRLSATATPALLASG